MSKDEPNRGLPVTAEGALLAELHEQLAALLAGNDARDRNSLTIEQIEDRIQKSVVRSIDQHIRQAGLGPSPNVHVEITPRSRHPLSVLLRRLRTAMYGLAVLGVTSIVGGSFVAALTSTTIAIGLLSSAIAGLTGLILELCENLNDS